MWVKIGRVIESAVDALTKASSRHILALHLCVAVANKPTVSPLTLLRCKLPTDIRFEGIIHGSFGDFCSPSILRLNTVNVDAAHMKRPQPNTLNEEFQRETGRWMDLTRKVAAVVPSMSLSGSIRNTPFSFDIVQAPNSTITPPKSHSPPAQSLFSLIHLFIEPHTPVPLTWTFETLPVCNLSGQNNTPRIPSKVEIRASMYCKILSLHPGKLGLLKGHQTWVDISIGQLK